MIFTSARQLKDRLKNEAHRLGIPPMTVMNHYMMERLLARLAASSYKDRVIIKGVCFESGRTAQKDHMYGIGLPLTIRIPESASPFDFPI
jgi:hypothetical protein